MRATGPGNEDDRRSALVVYDAATLTRLDSVRVGLAAHGLTTSPDGRTAFVTCYGSDELAVVALDGPTLSVTRVPVGPGAGTGATAQYGPYAALHVARRRIWSTSATSRASDVRVFDVARGAFDPARVALRARARRSSPRSARTDSDPAGAGAEPRRPHRARCPVARPSCKVAQLHPRRMPPSPRGRPRPRWPLFSSSARATARAPARWSSCSPTPSRILGRTELGVYPDAIAFLPAGAW